MAYAAATVTSSATPQAALVANIETLLTGHAAWQFVEEATSGGYTCRVWRCLGTQNGFGTDFFIALMYTATTPTSVFLRAFEAYDAAADAMLRPATSGMTTAYSPAQVNSWVPVTTALALSNVTASQAGTLPTAVTVAASMTTYVLVTNRLIVFGTSTSTTWHMAGLYTPWITHADDFPLFCGPLSAEVGISRAPGRTASGAWRRATSQGSLALSAGQIGTTGTVPGDQVAPSPALLTSVVANVNVLGHIDGLAWYNMTATVARGDTLTAGGKTWLVAVPGSGALGVAIDTTL